MLHLKLVSCSRTGNHIRLPKYIPDSDICNTFVDIVRQKLNTLADSG